MARRMRGNSHVRCRAGEKMEITSKSYLSLLMTTNGQSPFVTLFLNIDENDEYAEEVALIVQEILKQRIQGIKNEKGIYTTPAFPKLIYVLHEHNAYEGGKYDYVTDIAVKCSAKRLYPDYSVTCCLDKISA